MATTESATSSTSTVTSYSEERSGVSVTEVVDVKVEARTARADAIDAQIAENETLISAYEHTQDALLTLVDALEDLNDLSNDDNAFSDRVTSLTSDGDSDAESLLTATIDDGVDIGTHEVEIVQVATAHRLGSTYQSSRTTELGLSGTLTLGTDETGSADVEITEDMSLEEIRDALNDKTDTTGISASIITVTDDEYMLVLTAVDTNQSIILDGGADTTLAQSLGLLEADGSFTNELQTAQPAIINVDGIDGIERDDNDIDDIIDGVTLHLLKAEEGTTISIGVEQDTETIKAAIETFVSAYNNWRAWVIQNQDTDSDGTAAEEAYLYANSTLRTVSTDLGSILGNMVGENSLGEFGITLDSENYLEINSDTLDDALEDDIEGLQSLFTYSVASSSSELTLKSHDGATFSGTLSLDIVADADGAITSVSVDGDDSLFTVNGYYLEGAEGSIYEGLTFRYAGGESASITVTVSQGLADQLFQVADKMADTDDGIIQTLIDDLEERDDAMSEQADTIRDRAEDYRLYLLEYYGRIEAQISAAEVTISLLEALTNSESS